MTKKIMFGGGDLRIYPKGNLSWSTKLVNNCIIDFNQAIDIQKSTTTKQSNPSVNHSIAVDH